MRIAIEQRTVAVTLCADKEVVMMAANQDGGALVWTSDELCADKDIIMTVIKMYGDIAAKYASKEPRGQGHNHGGDQNVR